MNKNVLRMTSWVSLAATIVPSLLYFVGLLGHSFVTFTALLGTLVWFTVTPMWAGGEPKIDEKEIQI